MSMFADVRLPGAAMFAPPIVFTSTFDNSNTLPVRPMTLVTGKLAPVNCSQLDTNDAGVPNSMYVTLASVWNTMLPGRASGSASLAVWFATVPLGTMVYPSNVTAVPFPMRYDADTFPDAKTFPNISVSKVLGMTPVTFEAFPEKYDAYILPVITIEFAIAFPAIMFPAVKRDVSTSPGADTFPTISMSAAEGKV
ncbi:hypothetical protein PBCVCan184_081L [Paramecium bursaria Chlorella virus Can18-4]|nr:hypothetical protein PBCVCan184_081L [Paramecium bursaria Chlorella virus Can18-4]